MKIAVISTMGGGPWGASEELWATMAGEALNAGDEVVVSVYRWPSIPAKLLKLEQRGAWLLRRPLVKYRKLNKLVRKLARPFRRVFHFKPDVVLISHGGMYDSVYLPDLTEPLYASSIPYVVLCNAGGDLQSLEQTRREAAIRFFACASRAAFVSHQNLEIAERQLAVALPNSLVVQNPLNLSDLTVVPWPSGSVHMASVARLDTMYKGQDVLFEALSSPKWRGRDWRLSLYGEGPDREYLEALAAHYGIADKVKFVGFVKDVRAIWAKNHLLVLPSRAEGVPMVAIEAMLCGRPSVVTDVGAMSEWIQDQKTGFVAGASSPRLLDAALERAWSARADWERIGSQAHESALAQLDRSPGRTLLNLLHDVATEIHQ